MLRPRTLLRSFRRFASTTVRKQSIAKRERKIKRAPAIQRSSKDRDSIVPVRTSRKALKLLKSKEEREKALSVLDTKMMLTTKEIDDNTELVAQCFPKPITLGYAHSTLLNRCFHDLKKEVDNVSTIPLEANGAALTRKDVSLREKEEVRKAMGRLQRVFDHVCEHGDPTTSHYTMMMSVYERMGDVDKAMETYRMMTTDNRKPDASTCNVLIRTLMNGGLPQSAIKVYKAMRKSQHHPKPDSFTYATLISLLSRPGPNQDLMLAHEILTDMHERRDKKVWSAYAYGPLVNALSKAGEIEAAERLIQTMNARGIRSNVVIYNSLLGAHARKGDAKACAKILQEMKNNQLAPNAVTSMEIFNSYEGAGYHTALSAVDTMDRLAELWDGYHTHPRALHWLADAAGIIYKIKRQAARSEKQQLEKSTSEDDGDADSLDGQQVGGAAFLEQEEMIRRGELEANDALEIFEACVDHGFKPRISRSALNLTQLKTAEGALLALEHALQELVDFRNGHVERRKEDKGGRDELSKSGEAKIEGPVIKDRGLFVLTGRHTIPQRLKFYLSKFKPTLVATDAAQASTQNAFQEENDEDESSINERSSELTPAQTRRTPPENTFWITKASLLRWVRDPQRKGWGYH